MKNNFKFLIVLVILLAGCICVGSTFAADITVDDVDDASLIVSNVDDTENMEFAHDSSQNVVDLNNNDTNEDSDKVNINTVSNHKAVNSKSDIKTINALSSLPDYLPRCNVTVPNYVVIGGSAHIVVNISGNGVTPNGTVTVTVGDSVSLSKYV